MDMKCALHVHTTFSDGQLAPEQMLQAYRDQGFKCVAITDHQFMVPPNYRNYLELLAHRLRKDMMLLIGFELDYEPWSHQHLLEIFGKKDVLRVLCHPRNYYLSTDEINQRMRSAPIQIDAIEVSHRGFYTPEYNISQIPYPQIATDDAHELRDVARCWIETEECKNPDRLFKAIRASQFQIKMA
jgi:histidinol phosphatase-like PHP family hydrolase